MRMKFPKPNKIKFPITVHKIEFKVDKPFTDNIFTGGKTGDWVSVRPCIKECEGKTYIGILLGGMPIHNGVRYKCRTKKGKPRVRKILEVYHTGDNPAIYIPDLKRIVFGYESWWHVIKNENDLQNITDKDINNVWYVKVLKYLSEKKVEMTKEEINNYTKEL
jgi:hypothetical protein